MFLNVKLNQRLWYNRAELIDELLKIRKIPYEYVKHPAPLAARHLADNKIVAWFQGRMKAGPRALGNRSILMSPLTAENKDILNAQVKFREGFRPFCASLLWEKNDEYLVDCKDEFFMITSFDVTPQKRNKIPAVVHVGGTSGPKWSRRKSTPSAGNCSTSSESSLASISS